MFDDQRISSLNQKGFIALLDGSGQEPTKINPFKQKTSSVAIYPNPFTDQAYVEFANPTREPYDLVIRNLAGSVVRTVRRISSDRFTITREGLPAGVYLLELRGNRTFYEKVIIR
jgi:hypothetical protein